MGKRQRRAVRNGETRAPGPRMGFEGVTVAGERLSDLVAVVVQFELGEEVDGLRKVRCKLSDDDSAVLSRAVMRVEAELLIEDAATLDGASLERLRTPPQRRHDALVVILQRMLDAHPNASAPGHSV